MVKRDLSLQRQAQQQLSVCCESVADKSIVIEYINQLEEQVQKLEAANKVYEKLHNKLMHEESLSTNRGE